MKERKLKFKENGRPTLCGLTPDATIGHEKTYKKLTPGGPTCRFAKKVIAHSPRVTEHSIRDI